MYRLAYNGEVAAGFAAAEEKQPTGRGPEGCVENGPAATLLVGYVSIQICALSASPARTALPAAHFERNDITIIAISGVHALWKVQPALWRPQRHG